VVPPGIVFAAPAPALSLPQSPWRVKGFEIRNTCESLTAWIPFFPRDNSTLQHFELFNSHSVLAPELVALPNLLGSNLRTLSMDFRPSEYHAIGPLGENLVDYARSNNAPSLPLEAFLSFPHLTSLSLLYTHGPSLQLVETLASSSPLLLRLSFEYSRWVSDTHPQSIVPEVIFPEEQILFTLSKLVHLKYIDLGTLPTTDYKKYKGLKDRLEAEGTEVQYNRCYKE